MTGIIAKNPPNKSGRYIGKIFVVLESILLIIFLAICALNKVHAAGDFVYFPKDTFYVNEGEGQIVIPVYGELENLQTVSAVAGLYYGTAVKYKDYYGGDKAVTYDGTGPAYITVQLNNDTKSESDEKFYVRFKSGDYMDDPANGYYYSCKIIITDNDGSYNPSDDNELLSLSVDNGTLQPGFNSQITEYTLDVPAGTDNVSFLPSVSNQMADIEVNGVLCAEGVYFGPLALASGINTFDIVVTAENGTQMTYTVISTTDALSISQPVGSWDSCSGSVTSDGPELLLSLNHSVNVFDNSSTDGWLMTFNIDEYISAVPGDITNPCHEGSENFIEVKIPVEKYLDSLLIDCITYPDGGIDDQDISIDLAESVTSDGQLTLDLLDYTGSMAGDFYIDIIITLRINNWLPEGTVITTDADGGRFDGIPGNPLDNSMIVSTGEYIEIFAADYILNIEYYIERIL